HFPPELELERSRERPRLGQGEVDAGVARADHAVAPRAAVRVRGGQREDGGVEPAFRRAAAARQVWIPELVGTRRGTRPDVRAIDGEVDGERRTGLRDDNRVLRATAQRR